MAKQAITLKVAGRSYSLDIDSNKEELYRLAEREVNKYLARITQMHFENWGEKEYLSMTALNFAIANIEMRQSREIGDEDVRQLRSLDQRIDAYLNTLDKE